ncbi:hypothetical protein SK128_014243 [Halocaridina rubra]|uniref:Uncharacterized protein n=1 Tax=Halocaridina rubra TaxID=373956 RepID=A0AAN9A631_HALRR
MSSSSRLRKRLPSSRLSNRLPSSRLSNRLPSSRLSNRPRHKDNSGEIRILLLENSVQKTNKVNDMLVCGRLGVIGVRGGVALKTVSEVQYSTPLAVRVCAAPTVLSSVQYRNLHSVKFSRNLEFFSASDVKLPQHTIRLESVLGDKNRPMTILYAWLMSKGKHIEKYVKFYNNLGIDVLRVRVTPFDLLRPTRGTQLLADEVLQFLHVNECHKPLMIHGFSVGGYVFSEVMVKIEQNYQHHGHLLNRFVGQVWDSVADLQQIPYGTSKALTDNVTLQKSMQKYLEWFLKVRYNSATRHYEKAREMYMSNYLGVPGLFFVSDNDLVATPEIVGVAIKNWEDKGFPVYYKCWKGSKHVSHYSKYPKEYEDFLLTFMERIGMIEPARQSASSF